jgi:cytochrome b561
LAAGTLFLKEPAMSVIASKDRYSPAIVGLHWLMFLLIAVGYAAIELREVFPKGSAPRELLKDLHYMLGLSVLVLVFVRIGLRLTTVAPPISPPPPAWQATASRAMHLTLIAFMILMPIGGWLILSAEGDPIPFWGLELPPLMGPDKGLAETIEEIHETAGNIGYFLIGLHAAAALFHHYVWRDNTLRRMLPGRS